VPVSFNTLIEAGILGQPPLLIVINRGGRHYLPASTNRLIEAGRVDLLRYATINGDL
jgi:hypothetical protein